MNVRTYPVSRIDERLIFIFESKNPKNGNPILKVVTYAAIDKYGVSYYNLGFGDYNEETGVINDETVSDNGDMRKVLRTVVSTLDSFFADHPDKTVHITGSDQLRNGYYQKLIRDYWDHIAAMYAIQGSNFGEIEDFSLESSMSSF